VGRGGIPDVSIGLPVFNGSDFVADAIRSILNQTYADFELIISDNASTDDTSEVCRYFQQVDSRVRYVRQPQNLGAAKNYDTTFMLSNGRFFKWAAHDDVIEPTFLEHCVEMLDTHPEAVLACSKIGRIDGEGRVLGVDDYHLRLEAQRPSVRFRDLVCRTYSPFQVFGVMRSEVLARTKLHGNWIGSDRNLLAELALIGPFAIVEEVLFWRRMHSGSYSDSDLSPRERAEWLDPAAAPGDVAIRLLDEYRDSVLRVQLDGEETRACERVLRFDYRVARVGHRLRTALGKRSWIRRPAARVRRSLNREVAFPDSDIASGIDSSEHLLNAQGGHRP